MAEKTILVRPVDPGATLDISLDGRSVRATRKEPAEVPARLRERLLASAALEEVGGSAVKPATVDDILAAVGDDPERAAVALAEEQARGSRARKTLVRRLADLVESTPAPAEPVTTTDNEPAPGTEEA